MATAFVRMPDMPGAIIHDLQRLWLQTLLQFRADAIRTEVVRLWTVHGSTLRNGLTLTLA